jgi:hypothetical protein
LKGSGFYVSLEWITISKKNTGKNGTKLWIAIFNYHHLVGFEMQIYSRKCSLLFIGHCVRILAPFLFLMSTPNPITNIIVTLLIFFFEVMFWIGLSFLSRVGLGLWFSYLASCIAGFYKCTPPCPAYFLRWASLNFLTGFYFKVCPHNLRLLNSRDYWCVLPCPDS